MEKTLGLTQVGPCLFTDRALSFMWADGQMPAEEDGMWLTIGAEMSSQSAKEAGKCSLSTGNSGLLLTIIGPEDSSW